MTNRMSDAKDAAHTEATLRRVQEKIAMARATDVVVLRRALEAKDRLIAQMVERAERGCLVGGFMEKYEALRDIVDMGRAQ